MNAKIILALDIASATGWAVSMTSGTGEEAVTEVQSGTNYITASPDEHEGARYVRFEKWAFGMLDKYKPEVVYYEEVEFAGPGMMQLRIYSSFRAMTLASCSLRNIRCVPVPVSKNKLLATDNGGAKKHDMIAAARIHFPDTRVHDDNQADALHLLRWGRIAETGNIHAMLSAAQVRSKERSKERQKTQAKAKRTASPKFHTTHTGSFV